MPAYAIVALGVVVVFVSITLGVRANRAKQEARRMELQRLGFVPCEEKKDWLRATVTMIENNKGYEYEIRNPYRLTGSAEVYYYSKRRGGPKTDDAFGEEEVLFPLKRPSSQGLLIAVKPSALGHGRATRLIGSIATGPWDTQPDDLERIEVPAELKTSNLLGALGPAGARLYDLADAGTLSVLQRLGDAGAISIHFRGEWCTVSSGGSKPPFRLADLLAHLRPLL
jgi:hypothetical protein